MKWTHFQMNLKKGIVKSRHTLHTYCKGIIQVYLKLVHFLLSLPEKGRFYFFLTFATRILRNLWGYWRYYLCNVGTSLKLSPRSFNSQVSVRSDTGNSSRWLWKCSHPLVAPVLLYFSWSQLWVSILNSLVCPDFRVVVCPATSILW